MNRQKLDLQNRCTLEQIQATNSQKLTCKKEKEDIRVDLREKCISETKEMEQLVRVNHLTKLSEVTKTSDIQT